MTQNMQRSDLFPVLKTDIQPGSLREPRISRRSSLKGILGLVTLPVSGGIVAAGLAPQAHAETGQRKKGLLARSPNPADLETRSKIELELEGDLQINEPDPSKADGIRSAEVQGKSTLEYLERIAFDGPAPIAAARRYIQATAENWIKGNATSFELRDACRSTVAMKRKGVWQQYSPGESLSVREVELLEAPVNSSVLELLLPTEPAKPDASWALSADDACQIFNLEAVHNINVSSKIAKVENGKAAIDISGELSGTVNSVPTKLEIRGNYQVSMGSQAALVTWVGLVIKEQRSISEAEPGFQITARIKLLRAEAKTGLSTSADALRKLAAADEDGRWLVSLSSKHGNYSMLADRRWTMFIDGGEEAILRMVENNMVIAQCNITRLNPLDKGQQLTLEGLQSEIRRSLGNGFEAFVESSEKVTASGLRLVRVVAIGSREDVPIQWVYAHLSNDAGSRIALVYAMGGTVTDKFAAADEQMTASFRILTPASTDEAPVAAPLLSNAAAEKKR